MINWLKRHFIPHLGNAYRPHFLLGDNVRQLLGVIIGFELVLFVVPTLFFSNVINQFNIGAVLPAVLSTLTNEERYENNLPELVVSPTLAYAAQLKAEDMATKSYFAHTSPEGKTPWYWFDSVGYSYNYAGENLAINFTDSTEVTQAWMDSPTHRANIVGRNYTEMGTGIATGVYQGEETVFVAQVYASPSNPSGALAELPNSRALPGPAGLRRDDNLGASASLQGETVLGEVAAEPNFIQRLLSSPRQTTDAVLYAVLALIATALFFTIFIKFEHQHPDLITNGLVVAAIIFAIHLTNGYISQKDFKTTFLAFDPPQTQATLQE